MVLRKFQPLLFLFFLPLVLGTGCKKSAASRTDMLLGTWAVTGLTSNIPYDYNGDGTVETDIYNAYSTCQRDIVLTFNANGNGQVKQGCNAPTESMTWKLTNNDNRLEITFSLGTLNLDISDFSAQTIKGTSSTQLYGVNIVLTYTLSKRY